MIQPRLVVGVDPGHGTHGFAVWDTMMSTPVGHFETPHMLEVAAVIYTLSPAIHTLVVENFVGHGPRTKQAITTLKMLGFVEGLGLMLGLNTVVQPPQWRKPFVERAGNMIGHEHHYTNALAHALAYVHMRIEPLGPEMDLSDWSQEAIHELLRFPQEDVCQVRDRADTGPILQGPNPAGWPHELLQVLSTREEQISVQDSSTPKGSKETDE